MTELPKESATPPMVKYEDAAWPATMEITLASGEKERREGWAYRSENGELNWSRYEDIARHMGCTHMSCARCGAIRPKNTFCRACSDAREEARWVAMPVEEWTQGPLSAEGECLWDEGELYDWLSESLEECGSPWSLSQFAAGVRFELCERAEPGYLDPDDFAERWQDRLPAEFEGFDPEISQAIDDFNALLKRAWPEVWVPAGKRPRTEDILACLEDADAHLHPGAGSDAMD